MTAYIPIALVVLAFAAWAGYDVFYFGKPRPLWVALGLCLAGGSVGLFYVPALRGHPATQMLHVPIISLFLAGFLNLNWEPHAALFLTVWLIADRILAARVMWNLWRRDRRLFQMTARQFEEFEKARQAVKRHPAP